MSALMLKMKFLFNLSFVHSLEVGFECPCFALMKTIYMCCVLQFYIQGNHYLCTSV